MFQQAPKYLGVRLDRMLNFKQHLEDVAGKVTSRVSLIRCLAGTTWGASAKTLRISTQALVFPAAEYCAPVLSRSPHVKKVDVAINSSLRTISGCLKPTPVFHLPVLAKTLDDSKQTANWGRSVQEGRRGEGRRGEARGEEGRGGEGRGEDRRGGRGGGEEEEVEGGEEEEEGEKEEERRR